MTTHPHPSDLAVRDAWDFWLSQHPISLGEVIESAIRDAVGEWLDDHTDLVAAVIARNGRTIELPAQWSPEQVRDLSDALYAPDDERLDASAWTYEVQARAGWLRSALRGCADHLGRDA